MQARAGHRHTPGRRAAAATVLLALGAALLAPGPARADEELLLERTAEPPYQAYGWTFLGLSLVSLAVGVDQYNAREDELDAADEAFDRYRAAGTAEAAVFWRQKTRKHLDQAQVAETRVNLAIALVVLFGLTSYYSFDPESGQAPSVLPRHDGVALRVKF